MLLVSCSQAQESCPPPTTIDWQNLDDYASDESLPFQFPLADFRINQSGSKTNFLAVNDSLTYSGKRHAAEDVFHPAGTEVYAMADGSISYSGPAGGYGWLIIIDHPQANLYSLYGHLSPSRWKKESGDVAKGELIAYLGDTHENGSSPKYGQLTPHLHFGVRAGQRANYPGTGEWRWQAGWVKPCPQDLGWLQPSVVISGQTIPAGGFTKPPVSFLARWGNELLFGSIYLIGGVCAMLFAIRKEKAWFSIIYGLFLLVPGYIFLSRGLMVSYALFLLGVFMAGFGIYHTILRPNE